MAVVVLLMATATSASGEQSRRLDEVVDAADASGYFAATSMFEPRSREPVSSFSVKGLGDATALERYGGEFAALAETEPGAVVELQAYDIPRQMVFEDVATQISEQYPEIFVESRYSAGVPAVLFTAEPPPEAIEVLQSLPMDVEVRYGFSATSTEMLEMTGAAVNAVAESDSSIGSIAGDFDTDSSAIIISYNFKGNPDADSLKSSPSSAPDSVEDVTDTAAAAAARAVQAIPGDRQLPATVTVRHDRRVQAGSEADLFGGADLNLASNNSPQCTAGFTGIRSGERGLITARHCPDLLHFGSNNGWIQFAGVAGETPGGNWIDLQWHRAIGGRSVDSTFRSSSRDSYRNVTSRANPSTDTRVYGWGRTTGYHYSEVIDTTGVCYRPFDLTYCGLAMLEDHVTAGGDSGGPWFVGTSARGIHGGFATRDGQRRSVFTMIGHARTYMDTTVLGS